MTLADDYGDEPARFLARPVPGALETIRARIRGIQDTDEIQDWIECELAIGPRKKVNAALNQRKGQLQLNEPDASAEEAGRA